VVTAARSFTRSWAAPAVGGGVWRGFASDIVWVGPAAADAPARAGAGGGKVSVSGGRGFVVDERGFRVPEREVTARVPYAVVGGKTYPLPPPRSWWKPTVDPKYWRKQLKELQSKDKVRVRATFKGARAGVNDERHWKYREIKPKPGSAVLSSPQPAHPLPNASDQSRSPLLYPPPPHADNTPLRHPSYTHPS